jgi:hypothetical protein
MPTTATLAVKSLDRADEVRPFAGHGHVEIVDFDGTPVMRGTFEPGWRWSNDLKPIAGTDSCEVAHFGYCLSGHMRVYMDDGGQIDITPGDAVTIPPGHDAETIGDEACVFVDFGDVRNYARKH